jgi:hypothetical protein
MKKGSLLSLNSEENCNIAGAAKWSNKTAACDEQMFPDGQKP